MRRAALVALALGLGACGPKERPPEISPPGPTTTTGSPVALPADAGPPPAEAGPAPLVLDPVDEPPPQLPGAHVDIKFPIAEQLLSLAKAKTYKVRITVEHWQAASSGDGVEVSLDGERPRRLSGGTIPLADLVAADQELSNGPHWLTAAAVHADGAVVRPAKPTSLAPWALVRFWIGDRKEREEPGPRVIVIQPRGTYNGESSADRVLIDCLPFYAEVGKDADLRVSVSGAGRHAERTQSAWKPLALKQLPSGDFTVECALVNGAKVLAKDQRTITVNREAPAASD